MFRPRNRTAVSVECSRIDTILEFHCFPKLKVTRRVKYTARTNSYICVTNVTSSIVALIFWVVAIPTVMEGRQRVLYTKREVTEPRNTEGLWACYPSVVLTLERLVDFHIKDTTDITKSVQTNRHTSKVNQMRVPLILIYLHRCLCLIEGSRDGDFFLERSSSTSYRIKAACSVSPSPATRKALQYKWQQDWPEIEQTDWAAGNVLWQLSRKDRQIEAAVKRCPGSVVAKFVRAGCPVTAVLKETMTGKARGISGQRRSTWLQIYRLSRR